MMKLIANALMSACLLLMTVPAWSGSDCKEALVPGLPDPDLADELEMLRAQHAVKRYMVAQQDFLSCVQSNRRHNRAVERMQELAEKYNRMSRRYKARMQSLDMFTELV